MLPALYVVRRCIWGMLCYCYHSSEVAPPPLFKRNKVFNNNNKKNFIHMHTHNNTHTLAHIHTQIYVYIFIV